MLSAFWKCSVCWAILPLHHHHYVTDSARCATIVCSGLSVMRIIRVHETLFVLTVTGCPLAPLPFTTGQRAACGSGGWQQHKPAPAVTRLKLLEHGRPTQVKDRPVVGREVLAQAASQAHCLPAAASVTQSRATAILLLLLLLLQPKRGAAGVEHQLAP
jgi:hypothetical protein